MDTSFTHRFRVRYAEVDPQAVVFNSRYLEYADIMVTEFWRALGLKMAGADSPEFHVARAVVEYRQPLRLDQMVEGRIWVERIGNSSLTLRITLHDGDSPDANLPTNAEIELVQVHVDLGTGKSVALPSHIRALFEQAQHQKQDA